MRLLLKIGTVLFAGGLFGLATAQLDATALLRGRAGGAPPAPPSLTMPGCNDPLPAPAAAVGYTSEIFCDHFAAGLPTVDVNNVCGTTGCPSNQYFWQAQWGWQKTAGPPDLQTLAQCNMGASSFTGTISGTTLTVTAISSGAINANNTTYTIAGTGVTPWTYISALGTGTGGVGTYTVNTSQTVGPPAVNMIGGVCHGGWAGKQVNPPGSFANHAGGTGLDYTVPSGGGWFYYPPTGGAAMTSCGYAGAPNKWYGIAVPAASYVRWETFTQLPEGAWNGGSQAMWEFPTEFLAAPGPGTNFVEVDDEESYTLKHYEWYPGAEQGPGGGQTGFSNSNVLVIGRLIVKTTDNGGTGYLTGYTNDNVAQPTTTNPLSTWIYPDTFPGYLETQHMCLMINGPVGLTQNIKSVQVWSKYPLTMGYP